MSVTVLCQRCGALMGTWGGLFPPTYELTNREMGFADICIRCVDESLSEVRFDTKLGKDISFTFLVNGDERVHYAIFSGGGSVVQSLTFKERRELIKQMHDKISEIIADVESGTIPI